MAITLVSNQVVIARNAGALYGVAVGTTDMSSYAALAGTNTDAFLNTVFVNSASGLTAEAVASALVTNLGITGDAAVTTATNYIVGQLNSVAVASRGAVVNNILNLFSGLEGDAVFGEFAKAWNIQVANAVAYATVPGNAQTAWVNIPNTPNSIYTLTNGNDVATANIFNADQVYTPGGDNRINSLQDEDKLTGTGTNPTLNATLGNANDNGATIITPKLTDINTVNVAFTGSGATAVTDLDLQDATGLTNVNISRISQATDTGRVENIKQVLSGMSLASTNSNDRAGVAEFSFGTDVLLGNNTATLDLNNVQITTVNIGRNTSGVGFSGVGTQGYENLTINSAGTANTIGTLNLPMDTGTAGKLTITGDKNLVLANAVPVVNAATTTIESTRYIGGVAQASGRLSAVDASGFTGNLTLNIANNMLSAGKADTSGAVQNVTITGGSGTDTFILADVVQAGDSITGGTGTETDTLIITSAGVVNSLSSVISNVENIEVRATAGGAVTVDFDKLPQTTKILVRNEGAGNVLNPDAPAARALVTNLDNLTAAQAAVINTQHSNTGSNSILNNTINATLKTAAGATDLVSLTIAEGLNADPRFNLILGTQNAAGATGNVESITIVDSDTESNTVALASVAQHTGTITLSGGLAGTFLNLDTTTAGANGGLYQYQTNGAADLNSSNAGATVGRIADLSGTATQVRLTAATINASAEASDVVLRVSSSPAAVSVVGAQNISTGSGNDTVIFDNLADTRAGLTISDTVAGGAGNNDTLAIDGNVAITLGASEWTNVTGFENIRVIGNGVAANNAAAATNSYNLTLTNNLLAANKDSNGVLHIIADNDLFNDTARTVAQAAAATVTNADGTIVAVANDAGLVSGGVTIDARTLSAGSKWSFKGNEGAGRSADRIILSDANIDGNAIIDGGAIDNITNNMGLAAPVPTAIANAGNADVIEVRNAAVVSQGDLANVKNIGTLSFTNDLAITQVSTLQLNDAIVDAMVDSFQASVSRASATAANVEVLTVNAVDNVNVAAATTGLVIEAGSLTDKSDLNITLGRGANTVTTGAGQDRVVLLGNYTAGTYAAVENGVTINAQANVVAGLPAGARVVTDTINLGAGTDTLVTYGAINLAGATLTGVEAIVANSAVVITTSQWAQIVANRAALALTAGPIITFSGNSTHQLTIVDDNAGASNIDLSLISLTGGSLTYDFTLASGAGTAGSITTSSAVNDTSTTGDAAPGTVGTNPTNNAVLTTAIVNLTAGGTFSGTAGVNDIFTGNIASLVGTTVTGTAADVEALTITDAGVVTVPATITNIDVINLANGTNTLTFAGIINTATPTKVTVNGGTGADAVTLGAVGGAATQTAADSAVALGAGADTLTLSGTRTGALDGGADSDTITLTAASDLSGATISAFEIMNGNFTVSLTPAQFAALAVTNTAAVTLTAASTTITGQTTAPVMVLANGTNTVNAAGTANFNITGGTGVDTFNFGTALTANDTVAGGTGSDILTATGAGTGSANITAVETVQLNFATAATFTTGAMAPGAASTITAAGSTAAVTLDASAYVATTSVTIIDGAGNDSLTVGGGTDAQRALTTVTLSTGGADTITLANGAFNGTTTNSVTINNFTQAIGAQQDKIAGLGITTYQTLAAAGGVTAANSLVEVEVAAGAVSTFDAGDAGVVEAALDTAMSTYGGADGSSFYTLVYGTGANSGKAGLYQVNVTTAATGITAGNIAVELVGTFNGITNDAFVTSNFI
ncbi:beta strand repeat-containing protein [Candidatus Methylobacter oryzae]|uniref:Uncharacterized protein n=1 Tax=Candidatus Methylobacter oryzae TaxID=2497749 RepID=A0ABY3C7P4_9GAMM|nr:hypothetical protein [Candidatus Methylobacter oryzae]TRW92020.1 hypothetical protein EKO24_016175 [Candidatus Methylobacter oryzae]